MSSSIILIRALASLLLGTYGSMLLKGHLGLPTLLSLSAGLVIAMIVFWFLGYTNNKVGNNIFDKRLILLSLGIAGILIITDTGHLNPAIKPQNIARIIITASGEKNDS